MVVIRRERAELAEDFGRLAAIANCRQSRWQSFLDHFISPGSTDLWVISSRRDREPNMFRGSRVQQYPVINFQINGDHTPRMPGFSPGTSRCRRSKVTANPFLS
jgi:hypothetical protein